MEFVVYLSEFADDLMLNPAPWRILHALRQQAASNCQQMSLTSVSQCAGFCNVFAKRDGVPCPQAQILASIVKEIPKLNDSNYEEWAFRIKCIFVTLGLGATLHPTNAVWWPRR